MKKKILSVILALVMIAGMIPLGTMSALADGSHTHGEGESAVTFEKKITTEDELKDLFANGGSGYLANDIVFTETLRVKKNVSLCLNDKVIDLDGQWVIYVEDNAKFNLYDCGEGTTRYYDKDVTTGLWTLNTALTSGDYSTTGGVITRGCGSNAGAVYVEKGSFTMDGGNLAGNKTTAYGGGLNVNADGTATINGGTICGNTAVYGGGVSNKGTLTMTGGTVSGNTASYSGGGVDVASGSFTMNGGNLAGNKATSYGGGLNINTGGTATINGGTVSGNTVGNGGGISDSGTLTVIGGTISGNMATGTYGYAGGVYVFGGSFTMNGGIIKNNTATVFCGGVYIKTESSFTMNGGTISGNTAPLAGGVYVSHGEGTVGTFTMTGGTISDNTAEYGGGIMNNGCMKLTAATDKTITITGNTATTECGGIANWDSGNDNFAMHLSGKVIIKDNTCNAKDDAGVNYPVNLATDKPIFIDGTLTGSEIYITHANIDEGEHNTGVLTTGYTTQNSGAKLGDFFTYDGSSEYCMILNQSGELEVVKSYAITNGTAQDAHGSISFDKTTAAEGDTVTITVNPAEGYQLKSLTVTPATTIADVLATAESDFPQLVSEVDIPGNDAWKASGTDSETGDPCTKYCCLTYDGNSLHFYCLEGKDISKDASVSQDSGNYVYTDDTVTITFNMTGGVLSSIVFADTATDTWDGEYFPQSECIAAGTMISMPGGKQKAVENLEIGDVICTFDHETGEVSSAPVAFIWESKNVGNAFTLTFEDDIEVTVIEEHGFYDQEEQKYVFINLQNAKEYIGHRFYNADTDSWLALKSCEALNDSVDAYAIITSGHLNHMSNGMLSMCDGSVKVLANIFEYDDQMKFDADRKQADIETYGLTSKEKILEFEGFLESDYDDYNLQYLNVAIGKGLTTWEWIEALSDYCVENGLVDIYSGSETAEKNEAPKMLLMSATAPKTLLGSTPEPTPQDDIKITKIEAGTYQFTMPGYAVTVTAEFEEIPAQPHNVTAQVQGSHGSAKAEVDSTEVTEAIKDTSVVFTATPDTGYAFDYWEVVSGGVDIEATKTNNPITVTMPDTALTLKAYFKAIIPSEYNIIVEDDGHGTAKAQVNSNDVTSATPETTVTLTASPAEGYAFKEWQVIRGGVTITDNKFTMPANEVKIKAIFEKVYTVTVEANGHGSASADVTEGVSGKEVTLTINPESGYEVDQITVVRGGVSVSGNTFTIGTADVKIQVTFKAIIPSAYNIIVEDDGHGTAKAQVNSADVDAPVEKDSIVTLIPTPAVGYAFKEWKIERGLTSGAITNNSFTMPANEVKVKAFFEKVYNINIQDGGHGTASASATTAASGTSITLTQQAAEGYVFDKWEIVSGDFTITGDGFTMPASNVTIKATFKLIKGDQTAPAEGEGYTVDRKNGKIIPKEGYEIRGEIGKFAAKELPLRFDVPYFVRKAETSKLNPSPETKFIIAGCEYTETVSLVAGIYGMKLGGSDMGEFTFAQVSGGWSIYNGSKYLAMQDGKLILSDTAFAWTYKNGAFSVSTSAKTTQKTGGRWIGFIYIPGSSKTVTTTTTYYLSTVTDGAKLSTNSVKAELYVEASGEHEFGCWIDCKDGENHKRVCQNCGETETKAHSYDPETHKCVCGAYDPDLADVKISVDVKAKTTKQYSGFLFWGTWKNVTTYTATIKTEATGTKVTKVQYQLNGGRWTTGTSISSDKPISSLNVKVTDSNGKVYDYTYGN